jgi:hypothetical protein
MNPFLLYRKCYHAQAKAFCESVTGSQQGVSAVVGESWRRETEEVKLGFRAWAEVEKRGHREAWPEWRFRPVFKGKGKGTEEVEEEIVVGGDGSVEEQDLAGWEMPLEMPGFDAGYPGLQGLMAPFDQAAAMDPTLLADFSALQFHGAFPEINFQQQPVLCAGCACVVPELNTPAVADIFQYPAPIIPDTFTQGSTPEEDFFAGEFIDPRLLNADQF